METSDKGHGKREDAHIKHDIRHARADIHDGVICGGGAKDPVAPEGPNLEKGGEQERDQPGAGDQYHDVDHRGEPSSGEESSVEAKH